MKILGDWYKKTPPVISRGSNQLNQLNQITASQERLDLEVFLIKTEFLRDVELNT